jgi:hypothetical protein
MGQERRRVPRFTFAGTADIILESSGTKSGAKMREISLYGCRVETKTLLEPMTHVFVRIFGSREFIEVAASVIYANIDLGMALAFRKIEPEFEYVLKRWLHELADRQMDAPKSLTNYM